MTVPTPIAIWNQYPWHETPLMASEILGTLGSLHKYPKDVELCTQGSLVDQIFVLESGAVILLHAGANGQQSIIGIRRQLWVAGTHCLLIQQPLPMSVVTLTPSVIRVIPAATFLEKWQRDPALSWLLHEMHCCELREHIRRCISLASQSLRKRLEEFIWEFTKSHSESKCRVQLPLNHAQLSQLLAISLPHLNTLFKQLEDEGILRRSKGWLLIQDRNRLGRGEDDFQALG